MAVTTGNDPKPQGALSDALVRSGITSQNVGGGAPGAIPPQGPEQVGPSTDGPANPRGFNRGRQISPIMNFNTIAPRPTSRFSAGAVVRAFETSMKKLFVEGFEPETHDNFAFHILDNQNQGLSLSSILFCYMINHDGRDHCGVFNMIVEGSGPRLSNRTINLGDRQVEVTSVAGDVASQFMWDRVTNFLGERYGREMIVHNAGAMVLPSTLSAEAHDNLRSVLYYAAQALYTVINNNVTHSETPLSLAMLDNSVTLSASVDYNVPTVENAVGQPVRSDISIILRASQPQGNDPSAPNEFVRELTRVDSYIDLQYVDPTQGQQGMVFPYGQPQAPQRYYPRSVITNIDALTDSITLEHLLLGLSTATLQSNSMAWAGVYMNRYGVSGVDFRDIGAIGYEVNLTGDPNAPRGPIDTKSETFSRTNLIQLLQMAFHQEVIYSMDVQEVGELAWLHQSFIAAANNDQNAYGALVKAADHLTNGNFSQIWKGGAIAVDDFNRIHLGHYTASNGERRDIRDLDYLALLNLVGDRDMATVVEWSQTFDDTNVPLELRMDRRAKLLQAALPNCTITGYARRITFTSAFMQALLEACARAGLVVRQQNVAIMEGTVQRGSFQAGQFAFGGQGATQGVFTIGGQPGWGNRTNQGFSGVYQNWYQPQTNR